MELLPFAKIPDELITVLFNVPGTLLSHFKPTAPVFSYSKVGGAKNLHGRVEFLTAQADTQVIVELNMFQRTTDLPVWEWTPTIYIPRSYVAGYEGQVPPDLYWMPNILSMRAYPQPTEYVTPDLRIEKLVLFAADADQNNRLARKLQGRAGLDGPHNLDWLQPHKYAYARLGTYTLHELPSRSGYLAANIDTTYFWSALYHQIFGKCDRVFKDNLLPERTVPMSMNQLLLQGVCCGNGCKNCPYAPKHRVGSTDLSNATLKSLKTGIISGENTDT